jgi:peptidoglycan/xylan/chitin deacetylase (PgdA/CDA1 family)
MRTIPILMYHQVDAPPPKGSPMRGLVVAPRTFWWHMATLWLLGYRGLSMTQLEPYLRGDRRGKVFGITFDDGYENNLRLALPILKRFGFSSTCYVVAGAVGQENYWDAAQGIAQVPLMNAAQLQQWVDGGQEVGSHTLTHAKLSALPPQQQQHEISDSKSVLEAMVKQAHGVRHFCYPYGMYDATSVGAVQDAAYATATTTARGRVAVSASLHTPLRPLELPRVLVSRSTTFLHLLLKCFTRYEDRHTNARLTPP